MRWYMWLIALGWVIAAITIFKLGEFNGQIARYDKCQLNLVAERYFYICPADVEPMKKSEPDSKREDV